MIKHNDISTILLHTFIRNGKITFAANMHLKIYGRLHCKSGQRMRKENRVFFQSEKKATTLGYRPCAHCMNAAYKKWKNGSV